MAAVMMVMVVVVVRLVMVVAVAAAAAVLVRQEWNLGFGKFSLLLLLRWTLRRHWLERGVVDEEALAVVAKVAVAKVTQGKEAKAHTRWCLRKGKGEDKKETKK